MGMIIPMTKPNTLSLSLTLFLSFISSASLSFLISSMLRLSMLRPVMVWLERRASVLACDNKTILKIKPSRGTTLRREASFLNSFLLTPAMFVAVTDPSRTVGGSSNISLILFYVIRIVIISITNIEVRTSCGDLWQ